MKNKRLNVFIEALRTGAKQSASRLTLWLSCHGMTMPWYAWAESNVSVQTLERYRRQAMVSRLRAQRFKISRGPFFLRKFIDRSFSLLSVLQFPFLLSLKFGGALLVCLFPLLIFFVVRVYLPVPQRMVRHQSSLNIKTVDTSDVFLPQMVRVGGPVDLRDNKNTDNKAHVFFEFRLLNEQTSEGVLVQGKGGAHEEHWRGWRLSSSSDLVAPLPANTPVRGFRLKFKPIPGQHPGGSCKLEIRSNSGEVLSATVFTSQSEDGYHLLKSPLTRRMQEKLMPDFAQSQARLSAQPLKVSIPSGSSALRFVVGRLDEGDPRACDVLLYGFEHSRSGTNTSRNQRKNLMLMLFKSMNAEVADDEKSMPWMSSLSRSLRGFVFTQHHALDIREEQSFQSLMGLNGQRSADPENRNSNLIERLRRTGYKVILLGALGPADAQEQLIPDIAIRIGNDTYQARLALSQLMKVLEEESTTPTVIVLRLNGLKMPWWPAYGDLEFAELFFGGRHRGLMDTFMYAAAKSLDRELAWHFDELKRAGVFSKFDLIVTAERGVDLGVTLTQQDAAKATFSSDLLLNQESLRVPLFYLPAASPKESINYVQTVSTHYDLARTFWETLGVNDVKFPIEARRLWQISVPTDLAARAQTTVRDSDEQLRAYPLFSRFQEGVLFSDPNATSGFLKYVSQPTSVQLSAYDAYGWPTKQKLIFPAGEQFRQVSRKGVREEVLGRVNSRFIRESRRVMRLGRRYPLRLNFEFLDDMSLRLSFVESGLNPSRIRVVLADGLSLNKETVGDQLSVQRVSGTVKAGSRLEILGQVSDLKFIEKQGNASFVACPEGFVFSEQALSAAISQKSLCLLESPEPQRIARLRSHGKKLISVRLVEDEQRSCNAQTDSESEQIEAADCAQVEAPESE